MVAPVTVGETDLHTLLGIVTCERDDLPPEGLPLSLLAELVDQIRCDVVEFMGTDSERQMWWFGQQFPVDADDSGDEQTFWSNFWDCDACSYPDRSGDLRSVTKVSDFYSARQWHSTGMYTDQMSLGGVEHELMLVLPGGPGPAAGPRRTMRLIFFRGPGPDFSERDRALLGLLRPHLHQAYLDAERRRHGTPALTPRQWELLRLVAAGHTNAQIARRAGVTEGTVRKHLENIYTRLQVSSRTAAVTHAFPDRAAPDRSPCLRVVRPAGPQRRRALPVW
jgi:DNA-binding CsgD family transcriptional regulator